MQEKLDQFIDSAQYLPPSPRMLIKLLAMFKQPDRDIEEVVNIIKHDPSLTAKVLQRCNSAYFGTEKPARSMFEAVSRLGFQEIYRIILAMFAMTAILKPGAGGGGHVEVLWRHSVAVAVAASILAKENDEANPTAFTAGLLHEVGKVVMVSANPGTYAQAVLNAGQFHQPGVVAEKELFGFDHSEVGARLLERWHLPVEIITAVRHHHDLSGAESFPRLAASVHLANIMAHGTGERLVGPVRGLENAAMSLAWLQLTPESVAGFLPVMQADLEKAKAFAPF